MAMNTNSPTSSPQLAAILATTPSIAPTPRPTTSMIVGGVDPATGAFTIPTNPTPTTPPAAGQAGTGQLVVGGGSTPAPGAQPAAPTGAVGPSGVTAATTTIVPTTTATPVTTTSTTTTTVSGEGTGDSPTIEASGFGKAERDQPIRVSVGGATFGMPSFNASAKSNAAPEIQWGPGWSKVEKDGMWFMQHTNGMKAIPAVEYRVTPNPAEKVSTVKVANGWGKKFPDGSILVFDRKEGPYRLDPQGNKHKVAPGTHTIGGVKVRVFEATVVRTLDAQGNVNVFDSRGNRSEGSKRGRLAAAVGAADAGASVSGGGKTSSGPVTASGPSTASGPGGKDATLVGGGKAVTTADMTKDVQRLTEEARKIVAEIRSGNVDQARLTSLQAQLNALPSGILQAAGAAGTITSDGRTIRHAGENHATTPAAGASGAAAGASKAGASKPSASKPSAANPSSNNGQPPTPPTQGSGGTGTTVGNGGTPPAQGTSGTGASSTNGTTGGSATGGGAAPVAGVDANATTKQLAAGAKAKLDIAVPTELQGKQARFAQLPDAVQAAVAKAFGSDQGAGALKADQLVAFNANGEVSLVEGGTVFTKHQAQVRGAGPGEEIALTVRPGRQPGGVGRTNANLSPRPTVQGGGGASTTTPTVAGNRGGATGAASGHSHANKATPSMPVSGGGGASNRISLFPAGGETRDVAFGGLNGSYTWATLPAKAKDALLAQLRDTSTEAGKAFASRQGSGWTVDPAAIIVLDAGYASFLNGLSLTRTASASGGGGSATTRPAVGAPVAGGGPSTTPIGHDARRPPVSGGGGVGAVRPGTAPPVPAVSGGGGGSHVGH